MISNNCYYLKIYILNIDNSATLDYTGKNCEQLVYQKKYMYNTRKY